MNNDKSWSREDWLINYPKGIIKYNDMLRHKLLGYDEIVEMLDSVFKQNNVKKVLDLGCGTGTLIMKIHQKGGYECFGIDRNEESINIAKKIANNKNIPVEFIVNDALEFNLKDKCDAIVSMFVPFSKKSQLNMLKAIKSNLNEGGIVSFMFVKGLENNPVNDKTSIIEHCQTEFTKVVRIEPWEKEGDFLQWNPVLLIEENNELSVFVDHDEIELFDEDKSKEYYHQIEEIGFSIIDIITLPKRKSAPPWSKEVIVTARKL
ncbi:class I SAM-dependent methyltransferase [Clostridiaceae bacterium M8S5]|nr:class I SAM-dependent methyltransferase [Clostridiaceae bacterium M8S5]